MTSSALGYSLVRLDTKLEEVDTLEFSQFANILYSIMPDGKDTAAFAQKLLLNIIVYPNDETNPLLNCTFPTFKSYFNGTRSISGIAKKVNKYIEPANFIDYIDKLPDGATSNLCDALKMYRPEINLYNASEICANIFNKILITATGTQKKKKSTPCKNESGTSSILDNLNKLYGTRLLVETKGLCPNDNCCKPLYININGQTEMDYIITQINPNLPSDSFANLIALCPDCSKKYRLAKDVRQMKRIEEIKKQLINESYTMELLANTNVEEGVERVLRKISDTPMIGLVPLNYDPVELRQKILPSNRALFIKSKAYVTEYYSTVHGIFQQLSREGNLRFDPFCMQVKINYLNLRDKGRTQPEIFSALVNWLASCTNDDKDLCEIVISYFIQKCEVFDAITE